MFEESNEDTDIDGDNGLDEILEEHLHGIRVAHVALQYIDEYYRRYILKEPCWTSTQTGDKWVRELLAGHDERFYNAFRMSKNVFQRLHMDLEDKYGLVGSINLNTLEALVIFLSVMGHGYSNREAQERFQRSGETISRYFSLVLKVVIDMASYIIKPHDPTFKHNPDHIARDERYMPHFKNCIGAIDDTHIGASIPVAEQIPYIGRKGVPTQNVMAVCDFNLCFTFVLAGWEGSAHDANVFSHAIRQEKWNFPHLPEGKYYLVDAGYPQIPGYLGPYKGERYHLTDFRKGRPLSGKEEIFNHAHSSLRSAIERAFGVLKRKWAILKDMPNYPFKKQIMIVITAMALHNYVRINTVSDKHFDEDSDDEADDDEENDVNIQHESQITELREKIARSLVRARGQRGNERRR